MGIPSRVNIARAFLAATLAFVASAAFAQNPRDCAAVTFSDEVLERFPRAPEACLDVISRDGQEYAVFNARLTQVRGNTMRVRFQHPDGSLGPTTSIAAPSDFRVLINGEPTRIRDVAPNQDLKAYVQVSRPMVALEPADTSQRMLIVPLAVEQVAEQGAGEEMATDRTRLAEATDPEMPATAGPGPVFALFSVVFACAALCLRALRFS
ncbi:MAG TPA: hypothetical protein VGE08_00930 [Steroidobacter sp.]|uniref:hypothetical protein n=1 Tax=Steroidobacter sp. TaxID=1978227 RepID=UPI002ED9A70F